MRDDIATQLQGWQTAFVEKAEHLEETAEESHNPEWNHEWAQTLKDLSHTNADTVEELPAEEAPEREEKPAETFYIGTRFSDMEKQQLDPIWPGWIYSGVITGVIGEEGTGKSTLMTALAARVSTGRNGPDGSPTRQGTVLYIGPEEFDEITILERLQTEEANLDNVVSLQSILDEDFKLPTHLELLRAAIIHYEASLVVIDPINSCIARGSNLNTNPGSRAILSPLQKILKQTECGLIFINHFTKASTGKTSARASGSQGIYDFLRIYCTLSIDQATGKVILHEDKNNLNIPKPANIYIERLKSGKLFFSGAGSSADFAVMQEQQRLSMGRQAILKIVDADPLYDFTGAKIHQRLLKVYPNMPNTTTRKLLSRMADPDRNGHVDILKLGYNCYASTKRIDILAAMNQEQEQEVQQAEETPHENAEGIFQKSVTLGTPLTLSDQQTMEL